MSGKKHVSLGNREDERLYIPTLCFPVTSTIHEFRKVEERYFTLSNIQLHKNIQDRKLLFRIILNLPHIEQLLIRTLVAPVFSTTINQEFIVLIKRSFYCRKVYQTKCSR